MHQMNPFLFIPGVDRHRFLQFIHLRNVLSGRHAVLDPPHRPLYGECYGNLPRGVAQRRREYLHWSGMTSLCRCVHVDSNSMLSKIVYRQFFGPLRYLLFLYKFIF